MRDHSEKDQQQSSQGPRRIYPGESESRTLWYELCHLLDLSDQRLAEIRTEVHQGSDPGFAITS